MDPRHVLAENCMLPDSVPQSEQLQGRGAQNAQPVHGALAMIAKGRASMLRQAPDSAARSVSLTTRSSPSDSSRGLQNVGGVQAAGLSCGDAGTVEGAPRHEQGPSLPRVAGATTIMPRAKSRGASPPLSTHWDGRRSFLRRRRGSSTRQQSFPGALAGCSGCRRTPPPAWLGSVGSTMCLAEIAPCAQLRRDSH